MHVGLFNAQDDLPGDGDPVEQVVDEAHVVDERVHVAGAEHEQRGQALMEEDGGQRQVPRVAMETAASLTVKSKAGMGVQRLRWIMARSLGRWPSLAPAKNNLPAT